MILALAVIAALVFLLSARSEHVTLFAWHHAYLGAILAVVGLVFGWGVVKAVGTVVLVDDAWQHAVHALGKPTYQSPLHWIYGKVLWPIPIVQKITKWLDERFSAPVV